MQYSYTHWTITIIPPKQILPPLTKQPLLPTHTDHTITTMLPILTIMPFPYTLSLPYHYFHTFHIHHTTNTIYSSTCFTTTTYSPYSPYHKYHTSNNHLPVLLYTPNSPHNYMHIFILMVPILAYYKQSLYDHFQIPWINYIITKIFSSILTNATPTIFSVLTIISTLNIQPLPYSL